MVAFVSATLVAASPVLNIRNGIQAQKSAKTQARIAQDSAAAQAAAAERAFNAANKKQPNLAGILLANKLPGLASTMVAGPGGVQSDRLTIGNTSLLGG